MSTINKTKLNVKNLELYYGDNKALKGIDIEIKSNRVTALIGPSGCGKSTFLRTLNRMNDLIDNVKITGQVEVDGEDIYKSDDVIKLRTKVGMVFQKPNLFPMSIYVDIIKAKKNVFFCFLSNIFSNEFNSILAFKQTVASWPITLENSLD